MLGEIYQMLQQVLAELEQLKRRLHKIEEKAMSFYDDVKAELAKQTSIVEGMKVFVKNLTNQIQANVNDPVAQQEILDNLKANDANLGALMAASTPAAAEAPAAVVADATAPTN